MNLNHDTRREAHAMIVGFLELGRVEDAWKAARRYAGDDADHLMDEAMLIAGYEED